MVPRPTHDFGEFSRCCANFLWEQQSYENTEAYASFPPTFWITYNVYFFLNQIFTECMLSASLAVD